MTSLKRIYFIIMDTYIYFNLSTKKSKRASMSVDTAFQDLELLVIWEHNRLFHDW